MHGKFEQSPASLRSSHVARVQKFRDFVDDVHACSVWPLVCVFVQIFDRFDGGADLDVQVAFELVQESWVVGHHPTIIADAIRVHDLVAVLKFASPIMRVASFAPCSMFLELLGVILGAHAILHARA